MERANGDRSGQDAAGLSAHSRGNPRPDECEAQQPEGDRLDVLVTLAEAWEAKHYPLDLPDAVEAIKHHMD